MIKKEIYPKTKRISCIGEKIQLTEKLDGSNLCFFRKEKLYVAQRNNIICFDELEEVKEKLYPALYQWIKDNINELEQIHEGSVICGEWLGMGKVKYTIDKFDKRWYMFAKANIDDDFNLYNLIYEHALFKYCFDNQELPKCIGVVPVVCDINVMPTKDYLDSIYEKYRNKEQRNIEGFVINFNNNITKYVRMKNGKIVEYSDTDHKGDNK